MSEADAVPAAHAPPPESTAAAILDAAERLFAEQGFDRTSIKQIGAAAEVNPALLYYYYGDKMGLYQAAIERVFGTIQRNAGERLAAPGTPADALRALLAFQAEFFAARPHAARLLIREIADHEARHGAEAVSHFAATIFTRVCDLVRAGQQGGYFRSDLRPEYAAISTIGQLVYFALVQPVFSRVIPGLPENRGTLLREFAAHAASFAVAALAAPAPAPGAARHQSDP